MSARQLSSGLWINKLGKLQDIEHDQVKIIEYQNFTDILQTKKWP
jgi:hypothetical protein